MGRMGMETGRTDEWQGRGGLELCFVKAMLCWCETQVLQWAQSRCPRLPLKLLKLGAPPLAMATCLPVGELIEVSFPPVAPVSFQ